MCLMYSLDYLKTDIIGDNRPIFTDEDIIINYLQRNIYLLNTNAWKWKNI